MVKIILLRVLAAIVVLVVLIKVITVLFVEPWVVKKIESELNKSGNHKVAIGDVDISFIRPGVALQNITIHTIEGMPGKQFVNGAISSLHVKGINLFKAAFKKHIDISEVIISNITISDSILFSKEKAEPMVLPISFKVGKVRFNNAHLQIVHMSEDSLPARYALTKGDVTFYNLQAALHDTLTPKIMKKIDLKATQITAVLPDSMYTLKAEGISYSSATKMFQVNTFNMQPNYERYAFASMHPFQTDCIDAVAQNISVHNFSVASFIETGNLKASYVEVEKMDLMVFRDKRKPFEHVNKKTFQELIYSVPGTLHVDSVGLLNGKVVYTEHASEANEPGYIAFSNIDAKIYKISNDTIYKTQTAFTELKGETYLMGKGKIVLHLKAEIFEPHNTFTLSGKLANMEGKAINPMLEKNAFLFVTSGNIDALDFNISANNTKATGSLTMRYHALDIAVKNKETDDTTAFKEKFLSFIGNKLIHDANPAKGEPVRTATIDYERDPEKFLFNYCFKAILTGMKSTLAKNEKEKRKRKK